MKNISFILFGLLFFFNNGFSQEFNVDSVAKKLDVLSESVPALNDTVTISVNGVTIQEFVRAIAIADGVNVNVDPDINYRVVNNFTNVKFKDVLLFLVDNYKLDVKIIGSIISLSRYTPPAPAPKKILPKTLRITYDDSLITMDLVADSLVDVAKTITKLTNRNVVVTADLQSKKVSAYIQKTPVDVALSKLAMINGLTVGYSKDGFAVISAGGNEQSKNATVRNAGSKNASIQAYSDEADEQRIDIDFTDIGDISLRTANVRLDTLVTTLMNKSGIGFYILSDLPETVSIKMEHVSLDTFLDFIFEGKDAAYRKAGSAYLFGKKEMEELQDTKMIQLQYRTVDAIVDYIPSSVKGNLEIIEFAELNSLLVAGNPTQITELESFLKEIDRLVPVVLIEVMIVESKKSSVISTGISAGFGEAPGTASTILSHSSSGSGGIDFSFDASDVNKLLNSINGFGGVNIGRVSESFYLNINALENNGVVKVRSTPKLSTLNGHEAQLSSGETTYYADETRSFTSSQSINETYTKQYKAVNADLTIVIKPIVSGDNQITLDIDVSQSDFTPVVEKGSPPGSINRSFKSIIRVKDQEMVLLGGLDKTASSNTGSGIPILSKIPVLKWVFSSRRKEKVFDKLNIFIKPTVIN